MSRFSLIVEQTSRKLYLRPYVAHYIDTLLGHLVHSLGKVFHVARIDSSHRSSRGGENIHVELGTKSVDLLGSETRVREHSALLRDVRPVASGASLLQVLHEQSTHILDALRHCGALSLPLLEQHRIVQNGGDDASAIQRRTGPQAARADLQLLDGVLALLRVGSDDRHDAGSLSIETEVLREGESESHVVAVRDELAEGVGVVGDVSGAIAKIGGIEKNDVVLLLAELAQLVPLLVRGIHSGRVMSAGVEHEAGVIGSLADVVQHALEVQDRSLAIQVGVVSGRKPGIAENGVLVRPGRIGEVHLPHNVAVLQELSQKTERTRARDGLSVRNHILLLVVDLVAPGKLAGRIVKQGNTDQRGIFVILSAAQSLLSLSHAGKNIGLGSRQQSLTNLSMLVTVRTDTKNDLSRILISIKLFL